MTPDQPRDATDPAKARFFVMMAVRIMGVAMALFGMAMMVGRIAGDARIGAGFLLLGTIEATILPILMARRWRS